VTLVTTHLFPGQRVWRWFDTGAFGSDVQPLTVVRVNRCTVTVRTDYGSTFRIPADTIEGEYNHG